MKTKVPTIFMHGAGVFTLSQDLAIAAPFKQPNLS